MRWALPTSSVEEFVAVDSIVGPYLDKAAWACAGESGLGADWEKHRARRRYPVRDQFEILRILRMPKEEIEADTDLAPELRLERYQHFLEVSRPSLDATDTGGEQSRIAEH